MGTCAFQLRPFPAISLLTDLGNQWKVAPVLDPSQHMGDLKEAPGFSVAQPGLLGPLEERARGWKICLSFKRRCVCVLKIFLNDRER